MELSGGSVRGDRILGMQSIVDRLFEDDPSFREDVVRWGDPDRIPLPCRVYGHTYRDAGVPRRQIQTPYSLPVEVGDIFEIGDDGCWICIEAFDAHGMNWQGTLEYCNYHLRFLLSGIAYEYPVTAHNATQYNSGETDKTFFLIGSAQHIITIPFDGITSKIGRDTRFLIDRRRDTPNAYKLTQIDSTTTSYGGKGILRWTLAEDQFDPVRDSAEEMIADYYALRDKYELHLLNATDTLSVRVGNEYKLALSILKNGEPGSLSEVQFSSSNEEIASVTETGLILALREGTCEISVFYGTEQLRLALSVLPALEQDIFHIALIPPGGSSELWLSQRARIEIALYQNDDRIALKEFSYQIEDLGGAVKSSKKDGDELLLEIDSDMIHIGDTVTITVQTDMAETSRDFTIRGWF